MPVTITLRRNADGATADVTDQSSDWDEAGFIWTDGNYGCDCNRYLFFERAHGRDPDFDDGECGDTAYSIVAIDGKVLELVA